MTTATDIIARWVSRIGYADLPGDVVAATRLRVLDVVGLSIAGGTTAFGTAVRNSADLYEGTAAQLWGVATRANVTGAAFVNGALSQALEYDDTHNESIVHMSSPSVAAALALIDAHGGSGRDLVTAVAIGNEIASRVGSIAPGQFHKRGFHPSGLFAPFGTSFLAGFLEGLDARQMVHAAGIVGSFASGLIQCWVDGTQSKFLHPGWAAQSGIVAAHLARNGVTGPAAVLEGRFGLFAAHLQATDIPVDFDRLTRGLGQTWESRNASFKPFPAAHVIHPYIDALLRLRARHAIRPEQVARIVCPVPPYIVGIVCEPLCEKRRPLTDSHGRVSLPYTLAEALVRGRIDRHSYAEESLRDPAIRSLADRVDYIVDDSLPGPEQFTGVVRIEMTDGARFEETEPHNRGSAANPMSDAEIIGKFRENVDGILPQGAADRLIDTILALDQLGDATVLGKMTVPHHD